MKLRGFFIVMKNSFDKARLTERNFQVRMFFRENNYLSKNETP